MKQIWPNYSYSPATNVLTLTGLNIDRDQLLLVGAPERGRIMYNFADSAVTASAYTAGANTALTLVASTAGLTTTASLVIYYDDQLQSTAITISNFPATQPVSIASVTVGNTVAISGTVTIGSALPAGTNTIGTVTANVGIASEADVTQFGEWVANGFSAAQPTIAVIGSSEGQPFPISGTVTASALKLQTNNNVFNYLSGQEIQEYSSGNPVVAVYASLPNALPTGTNRIGVVTIGAGTVTIGAGTAQIGSVTASISGTVPVSISSVTVGNSVTIGSLPAISGTVTANTFAVQGTVVTTSNFTSTTASTVLANYNATREVLTIFNEGAGNLFVCPGATCTTVQYQIRLSSGDYYEVPNHQTSITHSAVFATAGTARVTQVS